MYKEHKKYFVFLLCLVIVHTLMAVPALADEEQPELVIDGEYVDPIEEPVEVEDNTPLDGNWCFDEEFHWRADAVSQGIPAPHEDENKDGICDVCQWKISSDKPTVSPEENISIVPSEDETPQTGDNYNLVLWIVIMFISAGVLTKNFLTRSRASTVTF